MCDARDWNVESAASLAHLEFAEELYYEQVKRGCKFCA